MRDTSNSTNNGQALMNECASQFGISECKLAYILIDVANFKLIYNE